MNGFGYHPSEYDDIEHFEPNEGDDVYYTDEAGAQNYTNAYEPAHMNGMAPLQDGGGGVPDGIPRKRNKKKRNTDTSDHLVSPESLAPAQLHYAKHFSSHPQRKDRIWNTSTAEERDRIKQFWLSLGEDDRRSLVKVEKEAVLKKMKEQQKYSCSCTVCGRKRTAIEEELEDLYDKYYEELEQYANKQQTSIENGTPIVPNVQGFSHSVSRQIPDRRAHSFNARSSRARVQELGEEDGSGDNGEDSEGLDEEDEDLSDDYLEPEQETSAAATEFFNFGNSLTVQGMLCGG